MNTSWDEEAAYRAYCAYGADLIRTCGCLVRTTPSVIFRATTLLQRYQRVAKRDFRSRFRTSAEMSSVTSPDGPDAASPTAEYIVPEYAGLGNMSSGLEPLVDLCAPLDFCVYHINDYEDIAYLCAACLLLAAKMEDPGVRIRPIVETFCRLSSRRTRRDTAGELPKPPTARYQDYKSCVVKAEGEVLRLLGFQTFVECPYKYAVTFLNLILTDGGADSASPASASPPVSTASHSPEFAAWLSAAVSWLNDVPRCCDMVQFPAYALAVGAIKHTCPPDAGSSLPADWCAALGVTEEAAAAIHSVYCRYLQQETISAKEAMDRLRACMPKPRYAKVSEKEALALRAADDGAKRLDEAVEVATPAAQSGTAVVAPPGDEGEHNVKKRRDSDDDDDGGIDLVALRKKRRKEEKERERKERREKGKDKK